MSVADGAYPEPGPEAATDDLEADIERTRQELGATAAAVAAKLDVPAQARRKVEPVRRNPAPVAVILTVALLGLVIWRRRRG